MFYIVSVLTVASRNSIRRGYTFHIFYVHSDQRQRLSGWVASIWRIMLPVRSYTCAFHGSSGNLLIQDVCYEPYMTKHIGNLRCLYANCIVYRELWYLNIKCNLWKEIIFRQSCLCVWTNISSIADVLHDNTLFVSLTKHFV